MFSVPIVSSESSELFLFVISCSVLVMFSVLCVVLIYLGAFFLFLFSVRILCCMCEVSELKAHGAASGAIS